MRNFKITVNGVSYDVVVEENVGGAAPVAAPAPVVAPVAAPVPVAAPAPAAPVSASGEKVCAPMPGVIVKMLVKVGDSVKKGDVLCLLEAMKMENEIFASCDGTVAALNVSQGASVNSGDALVTIA